MWTTCGGSSLKAWGPALSKLIAKQGMAWRDPVRIKAGTYNDRKVIWEAIVRLGTYKGVTNKRAARWLQKYFSLSSHQPEIP